ncbi:hypothetical protein [Gaoshiqia sp. Z1-71]|uniref:hypothetical protein n=1 Tax=Gaoshiqia hydrogeniformans TaxID=3290090 RepID=UPI003BF85863
MKKRIYFLVVFAAVLMSCGGNKSKSPDENQNSVVTLEEEKTVLDSMNAVIETARQDIEQTVSELDNLLEGL